MRRHSVFLSAAVGCMLIPATSDAQVELTAVFDSVDVNGMILTYRVIGSGDPLLLLHGFNNTGDAWASIVDELAPHYRLIIPDLRGHGRSTNPSGEFTHRQAALDILAMLDRIGLRAVKAMGISTGGMTLLHMATSQPDRVEAMVLIGATSYFPEQAREIMRATSPQNVSDAAVRRHSRGLEQARELNRQFNEMAGSYDDMNFTPPLLSTITARTLIVHGDRDRFFPVSIPVEEYAAIPSSYLWIVPNGAHVPLIGSEAGDRIFTETVLQFLNGDW